MRRKIGSTYAEVEKSGYRKGLRVISFYRQTGGYQGDAVYLGELNVQGSKSEIKNLADYLLTSLPFPEVV